MRAIVWTGDELQLLDQTVLPHQEVWVTCHRASDVAECIVRMTVRGAPAIGAAAAFGVVLEAKYLQRTTSEYLMFKQGIQTAIEELRTTRPTAVNLFWALKKMSDVLDASATIEDAVKGLQDAAEGIAEEDIVVNRSIGSHGANLFDKPVRILTHCNTGSLATVEHGTALGVIRELAHRHQIETVWVDETRPFLQGARLTAYELGTEGIPHTLITDNMAGHFMKLGQVDAVIVGADRIVANGDTANKIGTYSVAVLCKFHKIPFYVAAPISTFDRSIQTGDEIPIEQRSSSEVTSVQGVRISPDFTQAAHPAFDVTPHELIAGIITEHGVIHEPSKETIDQFFEAIDAKGATT